MQLVPYLNLFAFAGEDAAHVCICCLPEPEECLSGKLTLRSIMDAKALQRLCKGVPWCVCGCVLSVLHSLIIYFGSCGSCPNGFGGNGI